MNSKKLRTKPEKVPFIRFLDSLLYWIILFVAIMGNLIISIILIPFLLVIQGIFLYIIILLLAFVFGLLFDLLIRDLENIKRKQIIIAGLFIPVLAAINVLFMVRFSNHLSRLLHLNTFHNPFFIAFFYVIAFTLPHIISQSRVTCGI